MIDRVSELNHQDYLSRPRVSALLAEAARKPLAIVRAGAGCGKTRAVYDFAQGSGLRTAWMQLSGLDNAGSRFWSKYTQLAAGWSGAFTEHCKNLGFPDTEDKLNLHLKQRESYAPEERLIIVLDDIHLVTHPGILRFLEKGLRAEVRNTSVILICRELPDINLSDLRLRGMIPEITEEDLKFTEDELDLYLRLQDLRQSKQNLKDIQADTSGWPFSVNLVARSLKKSPGYSGYVRLAMRSNIFNLMETEVFGACSERLKRFLVKISLIDHLSAELIQTLAGEDCGLLSELRRENAYIRYDNYINAYHIHHLFLDFLRTKQSALPEADRREAYRQAAKWCAANGFESDALTYLENAGDYEGVAEVLTGLPVQMPYDLAQRASEILERAPSQAMESIYMLAVMRIRVVIRLGRWEEAVSLMRAYEERFLSMPAGPFRDRQLGVIYYTWGNLRALMSVSDGVYDFDGYFAKMDKHLTAYPAEPDQYADL
ncbi:MAG: hypothetical protein LBS19_16650, partial [Clostridiales bacterium]|nr:hypothetical protein [Clostridiales bacterium]